MTREEAIEELRASVGKPTKDTQKAVMDGAEVLSGIITSAIGGIENVEVPALVVALAMVERAVINAYPSWNTHGTLNKLCEGVMKNDG